MKKTADYSAVLVIKLIKLIVGCTADTEGVKTENAVKEVDNAPKESHKSACVTSMVTGICSGKFKLNSNKINNFTLLSFGLPTVYKTANFNIVYGTNN